MTYTINKANDPNLRKQIMDALNALEAALAASVSDTAYDATSWNGVTTVAPSKNAIRDQIEVIKADYVPDTGNTTIAGVKTFSSDPLIPDEAYGSGWDGSLEPPTKNAIYDKFENLVLSGTTFTPTILDDSLSDSESQTYTARGGIWRRIGDLVFFEIDITVNSLGTLTTSQGAKIGGLPFTAGTTNNLNASVNCSFGASLNITAGNYISGIISTNTNYIQLLKWSATTGTTTLTLAEFSTGGQILCAGHYVVAV